MSEPARIDKELVVLVGRNRENPRTHREAFEITGGLGEMLDKHIKRNNLNKSEFIREAVAAKLEAEMPKEPLIKDEKIRKAVRAWADLYGYKFVTHRFYTTTTGHKWSLLARESQEICLPELNGLGESKDYTIAELCGEGEG